MITIVRTRSATAAAAGKKGKAVTSGGSTRNTGRKERVEDGDLAEKSSFFEDDDDIGNTLHAKDGKLGFYTSSKGFAYATNFLVDIASQVHSDRYTLKGRSVLIYSAVKSFLQDTKLES